MNALTTLPPGGIPAAFASAGSLPDMAAAASANLRASFAVIGYKGRNWRVKYRGEEELLQDERNVPVPFLEVVIVGISPNISKIWYAKGYSEGDSAPPDCFSTTGMTPDPASPKRQCSTCAACPQNVFGSKITEQGKKAKACQDSRRLAVVPADDMENESYDGPMLLRIPPVTLANLDKYARDLKRFGAHVQPFMVRTQLGFNYDVAFPEITFTPLGWLDNDQAVKALEWIADDRVDRILSSEVAEVQADPNQADDSPLAGGPPAAFQAPAAAPAPAAVAPAPAAVAPAPAPAPAPAAAAPAPRKASAFGGAKKAATPAAAPAAQTAPAQQPAATTTVVQQAPPDMEAAIDDLLS